MSLSTLERIFGETLGIDPAVLQDHSSGRDFAQWDSLAHLTIISRLEEEFGVEFEVEHIQSMRTYGQIKNILRDLGKL